MNETEHLRALREAAGLKQKELAAMIGIGNSYMTDIEQGTRPVPAHLLAKLPPAIREPLVRARIAELEKLL